MASMVSRLWYMANSLFFKIFLSFWIIVLLTVITAMLIVHLGTKDNYPLPNWAKRELQHGAFFMKYGPPPPPLSIMKNLPPRPFPQMEHSRLIVVNQRGQIINAPVLGDQQREVLNFIFNVNDPNQPKLRIFHHNQVIFGPWPFHKGEQVKFLYIASQLSPSHLDQLRRFRAQPEILLFILIAFSLAACLVLAWHISRPLKKLRTAANRIAMGELCATLPAIQRKDEIGQLAESFSHMAQTLANAITNQRRLLSDISHELRSPLTRLNMAVALSYKRHGPSNELVRIEKESVRLEEMIRALLGLSRMQLDESRLEDQNLSSLLEELSSDCQFEASQVEKTFRVENYGPEHIRCYPDALLSAIENLCRNAIKYAQKLVELKITTKENQLYIQVQDDGPGIDKEELEQIFRPFYRASKARDRDSGGVGLGLAIADWAIRHHGGMIRASNRTDHSGLCVTMTIPYMPNQTNE
ncbi:MAG: Sensor histidine kinase CpxA [Candidatus Celerinatantimonas neptuna]|nr:MAG: Sensor histidine kinase CpxA [Candidatus Celerinatantimonas neptuna]